MLSFSLSVKAGFVTASADGFPFNFTEDKTEGVEGEGGVGVGTLVAGALLLLAVLMFSLFAEEEEEVEEEEEEEVEEGLVGLAMVSDSSSLITKALFLFLFMLVIFWGSSSFSESDMD